MNLASLVGSLIRSGADYKETLRVAYISNLDNRPPLEEKEVVNIVNSIWKTHLGGSPGIHCKFTSPKGEVPLCNETNPEVVGDSFHCNTTTAAIVPEFVAKKQGEQEEGMLRIPCIEPASGAVATNPMATEDETHWKVKPISDLPPIEPIDWLFEGYIARGRITELVGIWKSGKTTLLTAILKKMENGGEIAGRQVKKAKAIVISEESEHEWIDRRERLKLTNSTSLVCQPFKTKPPPLMWSRFIDNIATQMEGYELIIIDSLASLWPVVDENNSTAVTDALLPLRNWTKMGKAVLLVHHPKKNDATEGRSSRGSGGLPAYVDILLEFRRHGRAGTTKRSITAYSRRPETPPELFIDYVNNNYVLLGEGGLPDEEERLNILLGLLPAEPPGLSRGEILSSWNGSKLKPTANQLWRDLKALLTKGRIAYTGKGTKTEPVKYLKKGDNSNVEGHNKDGAVS